MKQHGGGISEVTSAEDALAMGIKKYLCKTIQNDTGRRACQNSQDDGIGSTKNCNYAD
ncbi:MAG: hypothetical protein NTY00_06550 [Deltaproteobacteria bacterium]|nr:hypothetical protein [Deltaproteobacteria bacterium]